MKNNFSHRIHSIPKKIIPLLGGFYRAKNKNYNKCYVKPFKALFLQNAK